MNPPVSITAKRFFFGCLILMHSISAWGQLGKDGAKTITSPNAIVNDYTTLTSNAGSGSTTIQVASNTLGNNFPAALAPGDLLFIIQVQGATMVTTDNPSYGNIVSYDNCGNHEFAEVASVSGSNSITLVCGLQNSYTASGKTVIVRVPRYASLTINPIGRITCPAWDGATGGIIAIEVEGVTTINAAGSINATAKGFRGGGLLDNNSNYGISNYAWPTNDYGGEKGESVVGNGLDYDVLGGRYCRGAPANGGGGGNGHNTGGGGGANAGAIAAYTGNGNPDLTNSTWISGWNLEAPGFAFSTSSGGGRGGYSFSDSNQDALVIGPGDAAWSGEQRKNHGGFGGKPLDNSSGKIFMGGGGGAGDQNDSRGGAGGIGGGIIFLQTYGDITGAGQIQANGGNGLSTTTSNGTDGAGGGGGGGSVLVKTTANMGGFTINANGGTGGLQVLESWAIEAEGPGGGGGGGYIATTGNVTRNANGGANGITNAPSLSEFPANGATSGGAGINNGTLTAFRILSQTISICDSTAATITITTQGTPPTGVTYSWYDQPTGNNVIGTGSVFTTPILTAPKTFYVGACPGSNRIPIQVNITNSVSASFTATTVCEGTPTVFTANGTGGINSWSWDFGDGSGPSTQQNPSHTYANGGSYVVTLTFSNGTCTRTTSQLVTVNDFPVANFTTSNTGNCGPLTVQFTNTSSNASTYSWNFGDGSPAVTQANPTHTYSAGGTYTVVLTASGPGCTHSKSITIAAGLSPVANFSFTNNICQSDTVAFSNLSSSLSPIVLYSWDFGDGSAFATTANPMHHYNAPGTYNVELTVSTAQCSDDTTLTVTIIAGPVASFNAINTSGCVNVATSFVNTSFGTQNFIWDFGDGSPVSTQVSPSHTYTATGSYSVTLIAIQGTCTDTIHQANLINVYNEPFSSFSTTGICVGDSARFDNLSADNGNPIISYDWNFGDGNSSTSFAPAHFYDSAGTFQVQLTVNSADCSDDTTISITVEPLPVISITPSATHACDSATIFFDNTSSGANVFHWQFGDGDSSSVTSPSHLYVSPGTYSVSITAESSAGCSRTKTFLNMIVIHEAPTATISSSSVSVCKNDCVSFTGNGTGNITSWSWSFAGGTPPNSGVQNPPSVCYAQAGNFDVALTVSNGFCEESTTLSSFLHVADCAQKPVANFIVSDTALCGGSCIDFVDLSSNALSWQWTFAGANPSSSNLQNPSGICYPLQGSYNVMLIVSNPSGSDTISLNNFIEVSAPVATPSITLNGDTLTSSPAFSYQWIYNGTDISGANSQIYIANLSGEYAVRTSDATGCSATSATKHVSLVGIDELTRHLYFSVYPNPVSTVLNIEIHSDKPGKTEISIFNILGKQIFNEFITMNETEEIFSIDLKGLIQGVYFIRVESRESRHIKSILKQ